MKQLICHFLGITYDIINNQDIIKIGNANIKFLYLLYDPSEVEKKLEDKYKIKVSKRYNKVNNFIKNNLDAFKEIFYAVLDYQVKTYSKEKTKIEFEMKLVDQTNYKSEIE